jgi:hypothetical protein
MHRSCCVSYNENKYGEYFVMTRTIEQLAESFRHVESLITKQKNIAAGHGDATFGDLQKIQSADFVEVCIELTQEASQASGSYDAAYLDLLQSPDGSQAAKGLLQALGAVAGSNHLAADQMLADVYRLLRGATHLIHADLKGGYDSQDNHKFVDESGALWTHTDAGILALSHPERCLNLRHMALNNNMANLFEIAEVLKSQDDGVSDPSHWGDFKASLRELHRLFTILPTGENSLRYHQLTSGRETRDRFFDARYLLPLSHEEQEERKAFPVAPLRSYGKLNPNKGILILRNDGDSVPAALNDIFGQTGPVLMVQPGGVDPQDFQEKLATQLENAAAQPLTVVIDIPNYDDAQWSSAIQDVFNLRVICGQQLPKHATILLMLGTNPESAPISPELTEQFLSLDIASKVAMHPEQDAESIILDEVTRAKEWLDSYRSMPDVDFACYPVPGGR